MSDRRFSEAEAAEIFRRAAEAESASPKSIERSDGLSLAELQEIGREAGLDPALVAQAAQGPAVFAAGGTTVKVLGLPLGVGRTAELGRKLSEQEWEQLVSDLRMTFGARGTLRYDGPFRQWSNGNLHVLVEPTATGHRIRFGTLNGSSQALMSGGAVFLGLSAVMGVVIATGAAGSEAFRGLLMMATVGATMFGFGALRLPGWARTRLGQMDGLIERLQRPVEDSRLPAGPPPEP